MRKSDRILVRTSFNNDAILKTIGKSKMGNQAMVGLDLNTFISSITKLLQEIYDERITFTKILIDNLASVWTDYKFYIADRFSHCGVNSFS